MQLFISYAHTDKLVVERLVDLLKDAGHTPWFDDDLRPGQKWKSELEGRIAACDALIFIIAPDSVQSTWCKRELKLAARRDRPIVPVLMRPTPLKKIPRGIRAIQYIDFTEGASAEAFDPTYPNGFPDRAFARLIGGLNNIKESDIAALVNPKDLPRPIPTWQSNALTVSVAVIVLLMLVISGVGHDIAAALGLITDKPAGETLGEMTAFRLPDTLRIPGQTLGFRDVAAANGTIWLATDRGLIVYQPTAGQPRRIDALDCALRTVAATPDGETVWFGAALRAGIGTGEGATSCGGMVGSYALASDTVTFYDPADAEGEPIPLDDVLTIEIGPDGSIWLGDITYGVIRRHPDGTWEALPSFFEPNYDAARDIALGPDDRVWVTDEVDLYRYHDGTWITETPVEGRLYDLLLDSFGRLWIATDQGVALVTLTSDNRLDTVTCSSTPPLPSSEVLALAATSDGQTMWLAGTTGYARVRVSEEMDDCATWDSVTQKEASAVQNVLDPGNQIELAIDDATSSGATIWVLASSTDAVYTIQD
jgi:streptogramin lyase